MTGFGGLLSVHHPPHSKGRWVLLTLLVLLAVGVRYGDLPSHFSHVDDYGVSQSLLEYQLSPAFKKDDVFNHREDDPRSDHIQIHRQVAKTLDSVGLLEPLIDLCNKVERIRRFAKNWTYAPAQFLLTDSLLDSKQSYRDKLRLGRVPSFGLGLLGLLLWLRFHQLYDWRGHAGLIAFVLLTLSWENIIYAKQQSNYSAGILAMVTVMLLVVWHAGRKNLSPGAMFVTVCVLILLCYGHYQTLFLLPALFFALLRHYWAGNHDLPRTGLWPIAFEFRVRVIAILTAGGLFLIAALVPLYQYCLRYHQAAGIHWNGGPNREFVLDLAHLGGISDVLAFVAVNTFVTLSAMTAVIPESSPAYRPIGAILAGLFLVGIVAFWRSTDIRSRRLGLFMALVALTWAGLLSAKIIALGPTRHSLILLPIFAIVIGQGVVFCAQQIAIILRKPRVEPTVSYGFCLMLIVLFLSHMPQVFESRQDPFSEPELTRWLRDQNVTLMIGADWTGQPGLMPSLTPHSHYWQDLYFYLPPSTRSRANLSVISSRQMERIAWISHRHPIDDGRFARSIGGLEQYLSHRARTGPGLDVLLPGAFEDYQIATRIEMPSDIEIDVSDRTRNGSNGYYLYLLERDPR